MCGRSSYGSEVTENEATFFKQGWSLPESIDRDLTPKSKASACQNMAFGKCYFYGAKLG